MTYKEKLIELFKTIPEIKKDLEELRFWCILKAINWISEWQYIYLNKISKHILIEKNLWQRCKINNITDEFEIIWNSLEERHLRMYCEKNNKKNIVFFLDELCEIIPQKETWFHFSILCKIDNTKSFDNQEDEIYKTIFYYLTKQKWEK